MALIKCKGCGQMVSDRAEKCPKCGYSVRLSMEQGQEETKQSVESQSTTETEQNEVINNEPQPQRRSCKKGIILAIVVVAIIGCGILFATLSDNSKNGSNGQPQDTTAIADTEAEAIKQDKLPSDTEVIRQDELPSDPLAIAKESDDIVVSDSCVTESWEYITLCGTMTDMNGTYPIELSFEKDGDALINCIYTNVDLGGKIKMGGEIVGSEFVFTGKDGMYKFQIRIDRDTFDGTATDGPKELSVSLDKKY